MHRRLVSTVALAIVVASCATAGDPPPVAGDVPRTTTPSSVVTVSESDSSASTTLPDASVPDLTVFIAAVDAAVVGTAYEGAPIDDPEVFIAVGQLFCELLDDGLTVDDVLVEYLTALEDEESEGVSDDDVVVTGAVMGASLEILCPERQPEAS